MNISTRLEIIQNLIFQSLVHFRLLFRHMGHSLLGNGSCMEELLRKLLQVHPSYAVFVCLTTRPVNRIMET